MELRKGVNDFIVSLHLAAGRLYFLAFVLSNIQETK